RFPSSPPSASALRICVAVSTASTPGWSSMGSSTRSRSPSLFRANRRGIFSARALGSGLCCLPSDPRPGRTGSNAPSHHSYDRRSVFRGAVVPAESHLSVVLVGPHGKIAGSRTHTDGSYTIAARVRLPGEYRATSERAESQALALRVVPKLVAGLTGSGARG